MLTNFIKTIKEETEWQGHGGQGWGQLSNV